MSDRSAFTERGTDQLSTTDSQDTISVATEENISDDWSEDISTVSDVTIRDNSEMVFEYEEDNTGSETTVNDDIQCLPRPKTGWNTSSFPSFGSIVPTVNNSLIFPQAPKTGRLYWNVATGGPYGHNTGVNDDVYLNRIEHVMAPRIRSRVTSQYARDILSKRPDLMPRNSNWAEETVKAWKQKFPDSTIEPDPVYQYARDPNKNPNLPIDQFAPDDIEWLRQRPLSEQFQNQRQQRPVAVQEAEVDDQWTQQDTERAQNQAHVTRATRQVRENLQPDTKYLDALAEFEAYVTFFVDEGHTWQRPAGLTGHILTYKNVTEQYAFERAMFLTKRNGPMMFYHPRWLQGPFR